VGEPEGEIVTDLVIRNGTVVDGTGTPGRRADVAVDGGRIVAVGEVPGDADEVIDATGMVVAPGFIDVHTHYDAQILWDPAVTPSPLHGVTTVIGGNCGFSIAPLAPGDADYVKRLMAVVEGIPLAALEQGADWDWIGFGEWLGRLDGRVAVNAAFMVGHSTLRRAVMGTAAVEGEASSEQIEAMAALLDRSLTEGALGFSSGWDNVHTDADGRPVPSRVAGPEEFLALADVVRAHEGTAIGFFPHMGELPLERMELMTEMSLRANRPVSWNLLGSMSPVEIYEQQLGACDMASERGGRVVALAMPDFLRMRANTILDAIPEFRRLMRADDDARRAAVADAITRAELRSALEAASSGEFAAITAFDLIEIAEARSPESEPLVGLTLTEAAQERGGDAVDVILDVVVPARVPLTVMLPTIVPSLGASDAGWRARADIWQDDRVLVGGSDAGAHLDLMCHANYPTVMLGQSVRRRKLLPIEQAIRLMTDAPARLFGLRERGRVAEGWHADLVVFDPDTVDSGPSVARWDLPGGGERLYADSVGMAHVLVGGVEVARASALTGALPGTVLRSGTDTDTVTVPAHAAG
jgi:N-acyl-D-aspartate/D-glutamate deacylase